MVTQNKDLLAFNRGVISPIGLARIDLERMAMSADQQTNWMPRVLGSMLFRPGLSFIDRTLSDTTSLARELPFTFSEDDTALLSFTNTRMEIYINDATLKQFASITAVVANGQFTTDLSSWTDNDEGTAVSVFVTGGFCGLTGDGTLPAIRTQQVTINESNQEHSFLIQVDNGVLRLRVGSTEDDDNVIEESFLGVGEHNLMFTPTTASIWIELANTRSYQVRVARCTLNTNETVQLVTNYLSSDLKNLRWDQSGDVIYIAADGVRSTKIERRFDGRSWSVVEYLPEDGPFRVQNTGPITVTPSALLGEITLTASKPLFTQLHATLSSLWRIASSGQTVTKAISGANDFTTEIRVVGSETARVFGIIVEGTFSATVTLQFAFSADGPWTDQGTTFTAPASTNFDDGQDDQIIFYRIGVKTGDFTSGTVTVTLTYTGGSIQGIARVHTFTSSTVVSASVLKDFGSIDASKDWWEGEWSEERDYPTAVSLHEGRLWWLGRDKTIGSVSDGYESFDDNVLGDSGPISRTIGFGPIRIIHWAMSMGRLLFGTSDNSANVAAAKMDGNHPLGARSNSFDEPLTPTNFNIKTISSRGVFVDRTKQRLYELMYDIDRQDYRSEDLSVFAPDFNAIGIVQIAVQMKPDIRVHCVRSDGTAGVLVYDRLENVICWIEVTSPGATGLIEDVSVLPGTVEDQVYYIVKRTINAGTQRHLCKWALESEAIGGNVNKIADSFAVYSGVATITPFTTELLHLRDETVVVWADGADIGTHTVSAAGAITLAVAASDVVAGLGYTARFKSAKLGTINGIGLLERKKVNRIGFIARNLHHLGVRYGPDFSNLSDLPGVEKGQTVAADTIHTDYHEDNFPFGGEWNTDSRICLEATAPRPCTMLAVLTETESIEKSQRRRS